MSEMHDKLDRWAEQLLDTGKRNNLISFKDTKSSTAEVLLPDPESMFARCTGGHTFRVFDPRISTEDSEEDYDSPSSAGGQRNSPERISKEDYKRLYGSRIKGSQSILAYALTPNPLVAIRNIAKRARQMQEETGINATYLAFGFVCWNEREGSKTFYRAPLLLVHVNVISGSIMDPIKIEVSEDDVIVNPTFNFLLHAERGRSLPEYEENDTLSSYLEKVAAMIHVLGWDVISECRLGIFSFLKINMYEDLKNNADLILANQNVRALLGEQISMNSDNLNNDCFVDNPLIDLHAVVGADSSQIEAIEMAKSGRSFVLQGPPGTGKSQTITNIIAECLYDGKRVLFVSEKLAALNVVFDKLGRAGLSDFCLELHSHKANKKAVIDELNRTLETPKSAVSSSAEKEIRQKKSAQSRLDSYAIALHERQDVIEKSLYQVISLHSSYRTFPDTSYVLDNIAAKGSAWINRATELLERYEEYVPTIGRDYRENPWFGFDDSGIDYDGRNQLRADLDLIVSGYKSLADKTIEIRIRYETSGLSFSDTMRCQSLLDLLAATKAVTPSLFMPESLDEALTHLRNMRDLSYEFLSLRSELSEDYTPSIIDELNGKDLQSRLTTQFNSFFSRLFNSEYKSIVTSIQQYSKNGTKPNYQQAVSVSASLSRLQEVRENFEGEALFVDGRLGSAYRGIESDWDYLISQVGLLRPYLNDSAPLESLQKLTKSDFNANQPRFKEDARALDELAKVVAEAKERVSRQFSVDALDLDTGSYESCIQKLESCLASFDRLSNWIAFRRLLDELQNMQLDVYVRMAIDEGVSANEVAGTFCKRFFGQWAEQIIFMKPELSQFSRIVQDRAVKTFAEKDTLQYEISKAQIKSKLSERRPNLNLVAGGSAVAILQREGQKKRRQMPIRRLLAEIGDLVQILKPCLLMSPLSVSTYLDPNAIAFDTIVFDEASQIFPQDAIGAIYRGKQIIVVGDSKQMPPSNFFSANTEVDVADDEADDVNDFESILDVCSSVFTTERLAWHYRSRYEQLIAFSNRNFYNSGLVTFPSSVTDHEGVGVDYYHVDGVFDRRSKTNRIEAEFVVERVFDHFRKYPERSLGVVAFSVAQQTLIDRLISKKREEDPSFESLFSAERNESFFVKNLETVQGDERDTIIFSIAYAPDSYGRFLHNFGPLNRMGGERRLNVAITRAKVNVQLVASIHYYDIDISRTGSEGAHLLRSYLDYAQNGEKALERSIVVDDQNEPDSAFELEVCEFLRDHGYSVDMQVGCSGYRIDLGLKKPLSSDYLLAIECDGATYHSSKNARDRDCLRQNVLERMGWVFYRIWSTDWFRNNVIEKERLLTAVKEATEVAHAKEDGIITPETFDIVITHSNNVGDAFLTEEKQQQSVFPEFHEADAYGIIGRARSFQAGVKEIIKIEGPLSEEYLLKRIPQYFGREKVTKVVVREYVYKMLRCEAIGIVRKDDFLYLKGQKDFKMHVPGDRRDIKYISIEELADGLYTLIRQNIVVSKSDVYRTLSNLLGYKRTTKAMSERYENALIALFEQGKVVEEDGTLRCP